MKRYILRLLFPRQDRRIRTERRRLPRVLGWLAAAVPWVALAWLWWIVDRL